MDEFPPFLARMDLEERIALCQRLMDEFEKHRDQIALDITGQAGKPLAHTPRAR